MPITVGFHSAYRQDNVKLAVTLKHLSIIESWNQNCTVKPVAFTPAGLAGSPHHRAET